MENIEITSANNWLTKAGVKFDSNLTAEMPLPSICLPMTLASEAIVSYRNAEALNEKIKNGLVVVTMVRIAETAYFIQIAKKLSEVNPEKIKVCQHCIRGQLWKTEIKTLRQQANKQIIHKMEEGLPINAQDLEIVEKYYGEVFKHPLINPSLPDSINIELCQKCAKPKKKKKTKKTASKH